MGCILFHNPFTRSPKLVDVTPNGIVRAATDMPSSAVCTDFSTGSIPRSCSVPAMPVSVPPAGYANQVPSDFNYHDEEQAEHRVSQEGPSQKIKIPRSSSADSSFAMKYTVSRKQAAASSVPVMHSSGDVTPE